MKSKMFLSANRPRVERHGQSLVVTLTDVTGSTLEVEMHISEGYCLANSVMELVNEYGKEKHEKEDALKYADNKRTARVASRSN